MTFKIVESSSRCLEQSKYLYWSNWGITALAIAAVVLQAYYAAILFAVVSTQVVVHKRYFDQRYWQLKEKGL